MYQNIYFDRRNNDIHLWDDVLGYHKLPYTRYAYKVDDDGKYTTLDGKSVRKVLKWSTDDTAAGLMYENDVLPEMRTLIDYYHESDEISTNHCVMFLDIEVAKEGKYSLPQDADNTITSISFYDSISEEYTCYLLDTQKKIDTSIFKEVTVVTFRTEHALLLKFIEVWNSLPITIVTGWNVLWFDMEYLYNRIEKVLGKYQGNYFSPIRKVNYYETKQGKKIFNIAGVSILDYMMLYKKFTYTELSNYKLDNVARIELGRGKIPYDKDLDHLLETDPIKFIEYNIEDVRLIVDLDAKLDHIGIAMGVCHKGHVPYEDVFYTSRYMEGACLTETKRRGIIATQNKMSGVSGKAKGAFVKRSRPGRYKWVYDLDLTSLYPSNIMSLNISPETKYGKIANWDSFEFLQDVEKEYETELYTEDIIQVTTIKSTVLRQYITDHNLSVAANGVLYSLDEVGLIPSLLDVWFSERAKYRSLAAEYNLAGDSVNEEFYERSQKIQKVLLNSLYGVLLLPMFRFYDKDNGEAVTLTGQQLIHYTTKIANHYYNKEIGSDDIDYCLYTDTDSVFYESMPLIKRMYPSYTEDEIPDLTIEVATTIQNYINDAYDLYAKEFHMLNSHRWEIKQELVAKRAFWGRAKKRYAMWLVRDGNKVVNKSDIKGFDSVRSSFPKIFRKFLKDIIEMILQDANPNELNEFVMEFKQRLQEYPMTEIMNPTSVKNMTKWIPTMMHKTQSGDMIEVPDHNIRYLKGTPIHVKSARNYNAIKQSQQLLSTPDIQDGDKILWAYLKNNPYDFDTMAILGYDDPEEIINFTERYINRDKIFDRALGGKLQDLWDDLGWGSIIMNPNVSKVFDFS